MEPKIFDKKCVNTAFLLRKWVNTAFLLRKFVNAAFFVAKFCKYALIDSFQGYPAVVDSSASCAALLSGKNIGFQSEPSFTTASECVAMRSEAIVKYGHSVPAAQWSTTSGHSLNVLLVPSQWEVPFQLLCHLIF